MCESTGDGCFSSQNEVIFSTDHGLVFFGYLRLEGLGCRSRLSDFKASILVDLAFWT